MLHLNSVYRPIPNSQIMIRMDVYQIKSNAGLLMEDRHSFVISYGGKIWGYMPIKQKTLHMYFERLTIEKLISNIYTYVATVRIYHKNHENFTLQSLALYAVAYPTSYKVTYKAVI